MTYSVTPSASGTSIKQDGAEVANFNAVGEFSAKVNGVVQPLSNLASIGIGQTLQDLTASRAYSTTYTNTTGRPILVTVANQGGGGNVNTLSVNINGAGAVPFARRTDGGSSTFANASGSFLVPPGATYIVTTSGGTLSAWYETR